MTQTELLEWMFPEIRQVTKVFNFIIEKEQKKRFQVKIAYKVDGRLVDFQELQQKAIILDYQNGKAYFYKDNFLLELLSKIIINTESTVDIKYMTKLANEVSHHYGYIAYNILVTIYEDFILNSARETSNLTALERITRFFSENPDSDQDLLNQYNKVQELHKIIKEKRNELETLKSQFDLLTDQLLGKTDKFHNKWKELSNEWEKKYSIMLGFNDKRKKSKYIDTLIDEVQTSDEFYIANLFAEYIYKIKNSWSIYTEQTFRSVLEDLITSLIEIWNPIDTHFISQEPQQTWNQSIEQKVNPDYRLYKSKENQMTEIGVIETKSPKVFTNEEDLINKIFNTPIPAPAKLSRKNPKKQFSNYLITFGNLLYTNYITFFRFLNHNPKPESQASLFTGRIEDLESEDLKSSNILEIVEILKKTFLL